MSEPAFYVWVGKHKIYHHHQCLGNHKTQYGLDSSHSLENIVLRSELRIMLFVLRVDGFYGEDRLKVKFNDDKLCHVIAHVHSSFLMGGSIH